MDWIYGSIHPLLPVCPHMTKQSNGSKGIEGWPGVGLGRGWILANNFTGYHGGKRAHSQTRPICFDFLPTEAAASSARSTTTTRIFTEWEIICICLWVHLNYPPGGAVGVSLPCTLNAMNSYRWSISLLVMNSYQYWFNNKPISSLRECVWISIAEYSWWMLEIDLWPNDLWTREKHKKEKSK